MKRPPGRLGQGLANSVGFAHRRAPSERPRFGNDLVNHNTYVLAGDGCLMEGISQEAIALAGHLKLNKLIVLWDDNGISIDGTVSLVRQSPISVARFASATGMCSRVDGHDPAEVIASPRGRAQFRQAHHDRLQNHHRFRRADQAGTAAAHGSPLGAEEIAGARKALGWDYATL